MTSSIACASRCRSCPEPPCSFATQDLQIGGRQSNSQFQYTILSGDLNDLTTWAPKLLNKLRSIPQLRDVNTDQQDKGLETQIEVDRDTASRLGISPQQIDAVLGDSFGQSQVSIIYRPLNQYHVVMEADPRIEHGTDALAHT